MPYAIKKVPEPSPENPIQVPFNITDAIASIDLTDNPATAVHKAVVEDPVLAAERNGRRPGGGDAAGGGGGGGGGAELRRCVRAHGPRRGPHSPPAHCVRDARGGTSAARGAPGDGGAAGRQPR